VKKFLQKNSNFKLKVLDDSIQGRIGSSLTFDSCNHLISTIASYLADLNVQNIVLGFSNNNWTKEFSLKCIKPELESYGFDLTVPERPTCLVEVSWLISQSNRKSSGIYISNSLKENGELTILVLESSGEVIAGKPLLNSLKYASMQKIVNDAESINVEKIETVSTDLYSKYLIDKKLVQTTKAPTMLVNCMFGATEYLFTSSEVIKDITLYDKESDPLRLVNYASNPVGQFLRCNNKSLSSGGSFFIGFDESGERVGVYDINSSIELSSDSVLLLILLSLKNLKKLGEISISNFHSIKINKYAKALGFKINNKAINPVLKSDGFGNIVFSGNKVPCPIQTSYYLTRLHPDAGRIAPLSDLIDSEYLTHKVKGSSKVLGIYFPEESFNIFVNCLEKQGIVFKKKEDSLQASLGKEGRIVIKSDPRLPQRHLKIDCKSEESVLKYLKVIETCITKSLSY